MMKRLVTVMALMMMTLHQVHADEWRIWALVTDNGEHLTYICYEPSEKDEYISADNHLYEVLRVQDGSAIVVDKGIVEMPILEDIADAQPVSAKKRTIGMYCTHSDESYEPSDGYYSTTERGSIYQVANKLSDSLQEKGIETKLSLALHHPHDAGAYRRSRQTAVDLLRASIPDCLIDIHRDGIPDPAAYEVHIGGQKASKIRLLVGRGNQNAELNKEFALTIKAVADSVYPGLIKDIYMGKGAFNQDLLPHSILFECGTYTIDKERVFASMPMMADVLNRALYGGIIGSVGRTTSDIQNPQREAGGITQGEEYPLSNVQSGLGSGVVFLLVLLGLGVVGIGILSAGSIKRGMHKAGRNLSEMTGGLIGKKPDDDEDPEHS